MMLLAGLHGEDPLMRAGAVALLLGAAMGLFHLSVFLYPRVKRALITFWND